MGINRYSNSGFGAKAPKPAPPDADQYGPTHEEIADALDEVDEAMYDNLDANDAPEGPVAYPPVAVNERDPRTLFAERTWQLASDAAEIVRELDGLREDKPALLAALKVFVRSGDAALIRANHADRPDGEVVSINVMLRDLRWAESVYDVATAAEQGGTEDTTGGE